MGVSSSSLVSISVASIGARPFSEVDREGERTEALEKTLFAIGACGMTETMEEV